MNAMLETLEGFSSNGMSPDVPPFKVRVFANDFEF